MQKQKTPVENISYLTFNCPPNLLVLRLEPEPLGISTAGSVGIPTLSPLSHDTCSVTAILWIFNINAQETGQKRFPMVIISKNEQ